MVHWVKRLAAFGSSILIFALFYHGHIGVATIGGLLNLAWAFDEWFTPHLRRSFHPLMLVIDTAFLTYGVICGGQTILTLFLIGSLLLAWNTGFFLERWSNAPLAVQYRYLRRVGSLIAFGLLAGLSALTLQERLGLVFLPMFFMMLTGGILWLRLISKAIREERTD